MKTVQELLTLSSEYLLRRGIVRARQDAQELLAHVLQCKKIDLFLQFDRPLHEEEMGCFRDVLRRRGKGEPIQHIFGEVEFYGSWFYVGPSVLIPRHETEILLHTVVDEILPTLEKDAIVWDLCCGSGCLGIALKARYPELHVTLTDMSSEALSLAAKNAARNQVDVELLHGDLLQPLRTRRADLILCNPPYVSEEEYDALDREVRLFEPRMALVGGRDGLDFYRVLASSGRDVLRSKGKMCLEIGAGQKEKVCSLFVSGKWPGIRAEKDWSGHDRFLFLDAGDV